MRSRRSILAIAALALSATIGAPTLAGAPTYSGTIWCTSTVTGESTDLGPGPDGAISWTRKQINDYYRRYVSNGFCEPGSLDLSNLTQDP